MADGDLARPTQCALGEAFEGVIGDVFGRQLRMNVDGALANGT